MFSGGGRSGRGRKGFVTPIILTYVGVTGGGAKTLVYVRRSISLAICRRANRVFGTSTGTHLVRGVFFGGDPLRSNTVVVTSGHVGTTNYVLPITRGTGLPGSVKLHRHSNLKVSLRASTLMVVISRRHKGVSITRGNGVRIGIATRSLRRVLSKRGRMAGCYWVF